MPPIEAVILVFPSATDVANPDAAMVAALWLLDDQVEVDVMFFVLPSVYVPVAVNFKVSPSAIVGLTGVTAIDSKFAAVTVNF